MMRLSPPLVELALAVAAVFVSPERAGAEDAPSASDYGKQIAPLLRKYCAGCHNDDDREGELSLDSYADLLKGGANGAVVVAMRSDMSRLVRVLTGQAEPLMPPEDNERPKPNEIELIRAWIDAGARGPSGAQPDPTILVTPKIKPTAEVRQAINALAVSPSGSLAALAGYGEVKLIEFPGEKVLRKLVGHRGSVNAVSFSADGKLLVAAAGEPGLFGEARLWRISDGRLIRTFHGHKDSVYSVRISPDGKLLATGSYDQTIHIWEVASGKRIRTFAGHNGAIHELAFHPRGHILASCSDDRTVKLWNVADGRRLDTLGQSLKELYTLAFSPNGRRLVAGGVDNRIRVWRISASGREGTNRLLISRFAHDAAILRLAYAPDGQTLVSSSEDRLVKIWNAADVSLRTKLPPQSDWVAALGVIRDGNELLVGRIDGTTETYRLDDVAAETSGQSARLDEVPPLVDYGPQPALAELPKIVEVEPNDSPNQATPLSMPATASGRIFSGERKDKQDFDLFRFDAKAGEQWILETNARRSGSPLDTKIEVLHADGRRIERMLLRAVRDSEIEFRGIDSTSRGARLKHWEEIELNQYVYINGEVVKHYRQRRGPDSDNFFYPADGNRNSYFETSARAHPLGQLCYVVEPFPVGTILPDNGLPVFPLYYENDDESQHRLRSDSRLTFIAPADGAYLARVSDVQGFVGEKFHYELTIRRPQPNFKVTLSGDNPAVSAGSGRQFSLKADRIDNFNGPIQVKIAGLPPGFSVASPITIQAGHGQAYGVINASLDAPPPTKENWALTKLTASAEIAGNTVTNEVNNFGTIKLGKQPKVIVTLEPTERRGGSASQAMPEIVIAPGTTIICRLKVQRNGFEDRIQFDVNNLPHGVIVDNIGLSGVLIPPGQTERTLFLTAANWVPATSRLFHAVAKVDGNQASLPMLLHVRSADQTVQIRSAK